MEKPKPKPEIECAMCGDVESNELVDCDCLAPLYFNGTQCVEKNRCPCVDNHIRYVSINSRLSISPINPLKQSNVNWNNLKKNIFPFRQQLSNWIEIRKQGLWGVCLCFGWCVPMQTKEMPSLSVKSTTCNYKFMLLQMWILSGNAKIVSIKRWLYSRKFLV